jgi:hypothetical protein
MAVSQAQIVDLLYKQAFGVTKTDTAQNKSPSNESIPSPALNRGDTAWTQAISIPNPASAVANIVQAYVGANAVETVADNTTVPIGGVYPTWETQLTNWIPQEFGATYVVQVWVDDSGVANPTVTGTQIFADGSGGTGQYYYNYESGVLNFIGETIPAALTAGKVLYIVGYRYIGLTGVTNLPSGTDIGNIEITGSNIAGTSANANLNLNPNGSGQVVVAGNITASYLYGNGSTLTGIDTSGVSNGTSNLSIPAANGNVNVTAGGNTVLVVTTNGANVVGYLDVNGNITSLNANLGNLATANFVNVSSNINVTNTMQAGNVRTDNLLYANGNPWDLQEAAGSNTQIQYNDGSNNFGASANFTFDYATNTLIVTGTANVSGNLNGNVGNFSGNVSALNANLGNLATANFVSVSSNTTTSNLTVNLEISGNTANFSGNIITLNANLGNLVTANYANFGILAANTANISGNINANSANITSNLIAGNANITQFLETQYANVSANLITGNANLGNYTLTNFLEVTSNLQSNNANILGTILANVANVNGTITSGNANLGNLATANFFTGTLVNGTSNISIANNGNIDLVSGANTTLVLTPTGANITGYGNFSSNVTALNANLGNLVTANFANVSGNVTANIVNANYLYGILANGTSNIQIFSNANIAFSANGFANIIVVSELGANVTGYIDANGNVNAGALYSTTLTSRTGALDIYSQQAGNTNINLHPFGNGTVDVANVRITSLATPTAASDAATKQYVDDVAQGLNVHEACGAATPNTLAVLSGGTVTYNNGTAGVGATLITTGTYTTIDGVNVASSGFRILVKDEANTAHNGIYTYTNGTTLTRATDFDTAVEIAGGDFTFVTGGTQYNSTGWVQIDDVTVVGTDPIVWDQFSGAGQYSAANGIALTGTVFTANIDGITTEISGGNIVVKANAQFTTPNIGAATGTSISLTGNVLAANVNANGEVFSNTLLVTNLANVGSLTATGNISGNNLSITNDFGANGGNITGNLVVGNLTVNGNSGFTGNFTANNITANNALSSNTANITSNLVAGNVTSNALTAGRITFADTNGRLADSANLLYDSFWDRITTGQGNFTANLIAANLTSNNLSNGRVTFSNTGGQLVDASTFTYDVAVNLLAVGNANIGAFANIGGTLNGNIGNFSGNVTGSNLITAGNVFAPAIVQNASTYDTRISLSSASGIIEANTGGNATQFLPGGQIRLSGAKTIYGGTLDGSQLVLGTTQTDLVQNRGGNVTIQVGTDGNVANTWTFTNSGNLLAPGDISATGNITGGNLVTTGVVQANTANVATFVKLGNTNIQWGTATTTAITAGQVIASVPVSGITGVEFLVKGVDAAGSKYSVTTVQAVTDGTTVADYATYGTVLVNGLSTGILSVALSGSNIELQVTPASTNSTVWTTQFRTI